MRSYKFLAASTALGIMFSGISVSAQTTSAMTTDEARVMLSTGLNPDGSAATAEQLQQANQVYYGSYNSQPSVTSTTNSGSSESSSATVLQTQRCTGDTTTNFSDAQACANLAETQGASLGYNVSCKVNVNFFPAINPTTGLSYYLDPTCTVNGKDGQSAVLLSGYQAGPTTSSNPNTHPNDTNPGWSYIQTSTGANASSGTTSSANNSNSTQTSSTGTYTQTTASSPSGYTSALMNILNKNIQQSVNALSNIDASAGGSSSGTSGTGGSSFIKCGVGSDAYNAFQNLEIQLRSQYPEIWYLDINSGTANKGGTPLFSQEGIAWFASTYGRQPDFRFSNSVFWKNANDADYATALAVLQSIAGVSITHPTCASSSSSGATYSGTGGTSSGVSSNTGLTSTGSSGTQTVQSLQAQVNQLLALVQSLIAQLSQISGNTTSVSGISNLGSSNTGNVSTIKCGVGSDAYNAFQNLEIQLRSQYPEIWYLDINSGTANKGGTPLFSQEGIAWFASTYGRQPDFRFSNSVFWKNANDADYATALAVLQGIAGVAVTSPTCATGLSQ